MLALVSHQTYSDVLSAVCGGGGGGGGRAKAEPPASKQLCETQSLEMVSPWRPVVRLLIAPLSFLDALGGPSGIVEAPSAG